MKRVRNAQDKNLSRTNAASKEAQEIAARQPADDPETAYITEPYRQSARRPGE